MAQSSECSGRQAESLFPLRSQFRIARLTTDDAARATDELLALRELVVSTQGMYPSIERWFDAKVVPGLRCAERLAYVAYENENPVASAVLKRSAKSKFCHVRVKDDFQDQDLGQIFFTLMTLEVRHLAKEIHFTLPESLWSRRRHFFQSFGFSSVCDSQRQYRHGDRELACSAPVSSVLSTLLEKVTNLATKFSARGLPLAPKMLMSVRPKYADRILTGEKRVELRRSFSKRWVGSRVAIYASRPTKSLVAQATVGSATRGHPEEIWSEFRHGMGCSREEFDSYVGSAENVWAVELANVAPYTYLVPLAQISALLGRSLKAPQSYCGVNEARGGAWATAVSLAGLLHAGCRTLDEDDG